MHAYNTCSKKHLLLNIHFLYVSPKYLLESHRRYTCTKSLLQLCVSDGPQAYAVGSLPIVPPPPSAALMWPPWMDPIISSEQ